MGRGGNSPRKLLDDFINDIPADRLKGFSERGTIWPVHSSGEDNFRLDNQGKNTKLNSDGEETYNLQIQANDQSKSTSIRQIAPRTVAGPVKATSNADPEDVRQAFRDNKLI